MPKSTVSRTQVVQIHARLSEVCTQTDCPPGQCRYVGDASDASVATEFGVNPNNIASLRREFFGDLAKRGPGSASDLEPLRQEIANLNSRYLQVLSALNELIVKHNSLVNTMELNRVAPVKHLAVLRPEAHQ